jgi:flagellar biosynthesis chaperone FliJ
VKLRNDIELENTKEKLRILEEGYDELRRETEGDEELRTAEMDSMRKLIHQLKEDIARYQARRSTRTG